MPKDLESRAREECYNYSSLLYSKGKDKEFIHDSYFEFFLARYFADNINSGILSIKDAYVNFWSYEEDAKLWGLPKDKEWRAILPSYVSIILNLAYHLEECRGQRIEYGGVNIFF